MNIHQLIGDLSTAFIIHDTESISACLGSIHRSLEKAKLQAKGNSEMLNKLEICELSLNLYCEFITGELGAENPLAVMAEHAGLTLEGCIEHARLNDLQRDAAVHSGGF